MIELDITFGKQQSISVNGEIQKPNADGVVNIQADKNVIEAISVSGKDLPINGKRALLTIKQNGSVVKNEDGVIKFVIKKNGNVIAPDTDGAINITTEGGSTSTDVILWDAESNLNNYTETGILHFKGYRENPNDNLPIDSYGDKVNIAFTLIVDTQEGKMEGSTHIPRTVSQTLFLGNRQGSETKVYVRNATFFYDGQPDKWESWRELMQTTYLGVLPETHEGETLKSVTENGLYTGAFLSPASTFDIFKLEVMNNYAMANKYGTANTVFQKITILDIQGADKELTRRGKWNGIDAYNWTKWEEKTIEIPEVNVATQTTLGIVKGSSTVEVQEDGSLHVNSDRLESAIADKLGVIKQGRNTHITADGAINVDGISNVVTDNDFNDGAINDIRVQFEPTKTLEELRYERQDVIEEGYSGFETKTINFPPLYPSQYDPSIVGYIDFDDKRTGNFDVSSFTEPNGSYFEEIKGSSYSSWEIKWDSYKNIWGETMGDVRTELTALKAQGYGDEEYGAALHLRTGFGHQPYMNGRYVFYLKQNFKRLCFATHYLYNAKDECLGEFEGVNNTSDRILRIASPRLDGGFVELEDYLPLRIESHFEKIEEAPTSGDFQLALEIYTEEITNGMGDWSNPIKNATGRSFVVFAEKYMEYPATTKTADLTRCISIGKDGILFQSATMNGSGRSVTSTEHELYIKFDESGNIVTNIGEFING